MRNSRILQSVIVITLAWAIYGCVDKLPLSALPDPRSQVGTSDTAYVEIVPPFEGFVGAQAILIGNDQLLYVADTQKDRIVMLNTAGQILSVSDTIIKPLSLSQDFKLDLLVGTATVEASGDTAGAIMRLPLFPANHTLRNVVKDTIWKEVSRPRRRFVGIIALPNNDYLAVRRGPDNSSFVDPDGRVLRFNNQDRYITPLGDLVTRAGSGITDINFPNGIGIIPNTNDFILLQSTDGMAYGALWMTYRREVDFEGWIPRFDPANPDQRLADFIRPNRFDEPLGVVVDRTRRDVFIADAAQDSIYKFDNRGRFKNESFGRVRSEYRLEEPVSLAFFDRTLYVLDRKNGRIYRYKMNTDF